MQYLEHVLALVTPIHVVLRMKTAKLQMVIVSVAQIAIFTVIVAKMSTVLHVIQKYNILCTIIVFISLVLIQIQGCVQMLVSHHAALTQQVLDFVMSIIEMLKIIIVHVTSHAI